MIDGGEWRKAQLLINVQNTKMGKWLTAAEVGSLEFRILYFDYQICFLRRQLVATLSSST